MAGVDEERIKALRQLVPEAFVDGVLDVDALRAELMPDGEESGSVEPFGLQWPGKRQARLLAVQDPALTLARVGGEGADEETTGHVLIEGENLEVLRILQRGYRGRVGVIYIDPPYNTGMDLLYPDRFGQSAREYLEHSGQADAGGLLTSNPKAGGRYHTNWLNMIYPRLKLARNLLRADGLICISIGDQEVHHLKSVMDELFGEENFINLVSVKTKVAAGASGGGEDKRLKKNIEYLLIYAKDQSELGSFAGKVQGEPLMDVIGEMREAGQSWKYTSILRGAGERRYVKTIQDGDGQPLQIYVREGIERTTVREVMKREGLTEEEVYRKYLGCIFSDTNAQTSIRTRLIEAMPPLKDGQMYELEYVPRSGKDKGRKVVHSYIGRTVRRVIWLGDVASEQDGVLVKTERLGTLWDDLKYNNVGKEGELSFPNGKKPVELVKRCLELIEDDQALVLDFFAGSGTTGHAVYELNRQDGGRRRFVLVQMPEPMEGAFATISELTKERLRRSARQVREAGAAAEQDLGYRVYQAVPPRVRTWQAYEGSDIAELEVLLARHVSQLEEGRAKDMQAEDMQAEVVQAEDTLWKGWRAEDLLVEILIGQGFPLDSQVAVREEYAANAVWEVSHETVPVRLWVCLDAKVQGETVRRLTEQDAGTPVVWICLDSALSDRDKMMLSERVTVQTM